MTSQRSGLVGNTYLHLQMYLHHTRQGADSVVEAPKVDPLIKWPTWGHVTVWKIYISIFMKQAKKLVRLLTLGRIFSTQTLKSSLTSCCNFFNRAQETNMCEIKSQRLRSQILTYFSSIIFKNITVSLKIQLFMKKCYSWGRTGFHWYRWHWKLWAFT